MRNVLLLAFLSLCSCAIRAQITLGLINDKDGFTNVRAGQSIHAGIIEEVVEGEYFYFIENDTSDWFQVIVYKNAFSYNCESKSCGVFGFMHESRIEGVGLVDEYSLGDFEFGYETERFSLDGKELEYCDRGKKYIKNINGAAFYGTDGRKPENQIKGLSVKYKGKDIEFPEKLITDIYNVNLGAKIYQNGSDFIVVGWHSDGAGGYGLVWIFGKERLKQRIVFIP